MMVEDGIFFLGSQTLYFSTGCAGFIFFENGSSLRKKNTKGIIINHKETRMVKDGED